MTVVHGIEIDDFEYKPNDIKRAIRTREPLEPKLHVIAVVSNPCMYARRYILMREFMERFERDEPDCLLYIVEMVYPEQHFLMTQNDHPRHLQLRTQTALWHKENMINLGIHYLLPPDWKAVAWIDADVEFESSTWAMDTLRILNGECDIVQTFSHCVDMDKNEHVMKIFQSAGFQYSKKLPYSRHPNQYWHPGYAWACTRHAYETMEGLFSEGILGSGDNIMLLALLQNGTKAIHVDSSIGYKNAIQQFEYRVKHLKFGYVPGVIRHYFHGSKVNRKYTERWYILKEYDYDPFLHITYDNQGVMIPSSEFPEGLAAAIMRYFAERDEDEGLLTCGKYDTTRPSEENLLRHLSIDSFITSSVDSNMITKDAEPTCKEDLGRNAEAATSEPPMAFTDTYNKTLCMPQFTSSEEDERPDANRDERPNGQSPVGVRRNAEAATSEPQRSFQEGLCRKEPQRSICSNRSSEPPSSATLSVSERIRKWVHSMIQR